jgi:hypothetical protein
MSIHIYECTAYNVWVGTRWGGGHARPLCLRVGAKLTPYKYRGTLLMAYVPLGPGKPFLRTSKIFHHLKRNVLASHTMGFNYIPSSTIFL